MTNQGSSASARKSAKDTHPLKYHKEFRALRRKTRSFNLLVEKLDLFPRSFGRDEKFISSEEVCDFSTLFSTLRDLGLLLDNSRHHYTLLGKLVSVRMISRDVTYKTRLPADVADVIFRAISEIEILLENVGDMKLFEKQSREKGVLARRAEEADTRLVSPSWLRFSSKYDGLNEAFYPRS